MHFYKLSEGRVRRVLQTPKRIEEGVAPDTVAMMQPASIKNVIPGAVKRRPGTQGSVNYIQNSVDARTKESWSQEIWVMVQDNEAGRKVISAWRYPGMSKVRSEAALEIARQEYDEFKNGE
jgi:hypothetical protein